MSRRNSPLAILIALSIPMMLTSVGCAGQPTANPHLSAASGATSAVTDAAFEEELDFGDVDYPRLHAAIFHATNATRRAHGRKALEPSAHLEDAARRYAVRMVDRSFLAHEDPYDAAMRTPKQRAKASGVLNAMPAENLATHPGFQFASGEPLVVLDPKGPDGPVLARKPEGPPIARHTYRSLAESVVEQWMDSPGHRKNLLSPDASALGAGAALYREQDIPSFVMVQLFQLYEPLRTDP